MTSYGRKNQIRRDFAESARLRIYRNAVPGKVCHNVQNFANQSALGYLFIDQIRHDNFPKPLAKIHKSWIRSVNNKVATTPKFEVDETDEIALNLPEKEQTDVDLPILYEDDDVIVVNKPSGLLTHAKGGLSDEPTVAEIIRPKTSFATDTDRPGIVHRLDRDTSGLLIIAKNPESAAHLQRQFAERTAKKTYIAITDGKPKLNAAKLICQLVAILRRRALFV